MKKIILTAITGVLILSSCSRNEAFEDDSSAETNLINFSAYSAQSPESRSIDADITTLQASSFSVYARLSGDGSPLMDNVDVNWTGSNWVYSPIKYWPSSGNVDFIAIGKNTNATVTSMAGNLNAPTITYRANNTPATQEDLLIASALNQSKGSGLVNLTFKHALSKLSVSVMADATDTSLTLEINSIELENVLSEGSCTVSNTSLLWASSGIPANIEFGLDQAKTAIAGNASPVYTDIMNSDGSMIIIPQQMTRLVVKGRWIQNGMTIEDFTAGKNVDLSISGSWEASKHYKFRLKIGMNNVPITFDATIDPWSDQDVDLQP